MTTGELNALKEKAHTWAVATASMTRLNRMLSTSAS